MLTRIRLAAAILLTASITMGVYSVLVLARPEPQQIFSLRKVTFNHEVDPSYYVEASDPLDPPLQQAMQQMDAREYVKLYGTEDTLLWQMITERKLIKYNETFYYFDWGSGEEVMLRASYPTNDPTNDPIEAVEPMDPWLKDAVMPLGTHVMIHGSENSVLVQMEKQHKALKYENVYYDIYIRSFVDYKPPKSTIDTPMLTIPTGWAGLGLCWLFLGLLKLKKKNIE